MKSSAIKIIGFIFLKFKNSPSIKIGKCNIGQSTPPFIIAEISGNHNHSLGKALKIVDAAAECRVNALKIQTYTADTITRDHNSNYDLYKEGCTPWEWHKPIMNR